jgi:predicted TIM-barrel fold metal-dependent hydrolase
MIIDTHAHIYLNEKKSLEEIIDNLEKDNIKNVICI